MQNAIYNAFPEKTGLNTEAKSSKNKPGPFFESSSVIYMLIDIDLRLIDFNTAAVAFIKKYSEVTLTVGTAVTSFVHKDQLARFIQSYVKVLSGIPVCIEHEFSNGNETTVWFISYEPALDWEGNISGVSYNAIDISYLRVIH